MLGKEQTEDISKSIAQTLSVLTSPRAHDFSAAACGARETQLALHPGLHCRAPFHWLQIVLKISLRIAHPFL